jgi:plastocyanin/mono/diheme cytochrome c family protein
MNTRKQVLAMVALLMLGLIGIAVYSAWDPGRNANAEQDFQDKTAARGALLFARNCRLCHGDVGQGGALGGRLAAAPALDRADLQGFIDSKAKLAKDLDTTSTTVTTTDGTKFKKGATILIDDERMEIKGINGNDLTVTRAGGQTSADSHTAGSGTSAKTIQLLDPAALDDKIKLITNTITCGRVGTPMPAWAQSQGGPLSDEQIRQLMTLITQDQWHLAKIEEDTGLKQIGSETGEDYTAAKLTADIDESTISLPVSDVTLFVENDAIRIGDERILIKGVPKVDAKDKDKSGILLVQRGALNSTPLPHTADEQIFKFPQAPTPTINQASCGQTAKAAVPSAPPGAKDCTAPCQDANVTASGIKFDKSSITVSKGQNVRIIFTNNDQATQHNFAVYKSSTDLTAASSTGGTSVGTIFEGVNTDNIVFASPAAGTYYFRCDVHPTIMFGDFIVQ